MIYGVDASFLVQLAVADLPGHQGAQTLKDRLIKESARLALAPQTLAEFVHVITDPRRFSNPLPVEVAVSHSERWWNLEEVVPVFPDQEAIVLFHRWMAVHRLGRKRLLDTLLAATFCSHGVERLITSDPGGFSVFGCFDLIDPLGDVPPAG